MLRALPGAVMLLAAALTSGCAYVTAQPVKPGDRINGIRIYDVKPLLVVSGENVTLQYVPNYNRAYALRFGAFLAKNNFDASISNGILTKVTANMDSTEFIKVLTALIEKLPAPGKGFSGPEAPETPGGIKDRFQVYDIVFDDDGNLVGLRPLLVTPNMLHVKTASSAIRAAAVAQRSWPQQGGGGGAGGDGVTPGPVKVMASGAAWARKSSCTRNIRPSSGRSSSRTPSLIERYGAHHVGVSKKFRKGRRMPDTCITFYVMQKGKSISGVAGAEGDGPELQARDTQAAIVTDVCEIRGADRLQYARRQSGHREGRRNGHGRLGIPARRLRMCF